MVATLFAFALSACHTNVAMILVWVFMQLGYAVMAMACSAMVGEMVPDKFRNAVATWRNVAMFAGRSPALHSPLAWQTMSRPRWT